MSARVGNCGVGGGADAAAGEGVQQELQRLSSSTTKHHALLLSTILRDASTGWIPTPTIVRLLTPSETPLPLSVDPPTTPPSSGSLFLYDRSITRYFRRDGHDWVKEKNNGTGGKKVREDHVKLRVGGKYRVSGSYAQGYKEYDGSGSGGGCVGTMRRRIYHLLRVVPPEDDEGGAEEENKAGGSIGGGRKKYHHGQHKRWENSLVLVHYLDMEGMKVAGVRRWYGDGKNYDRVDDGAMMPMSLVARRGPSCDHAAGDGGVVAASKETTMMRAAREKKNGTRSQIDAADYAEEDNDGSSLSLPHPSALLPEIVDFSPESVVVAHEEAVVGGGIGVEEEDEEEAKNTGTKVILALSGPLPSIPGTSSSSSSSSSLSGRNSWNDNPTTQHLQPHIAMVDCFYAQVSDEENSASIGTTGGGEEQHDQSGGFHYHSDGVALLRVRSVDAVIPLTTLNATAFKFVYQHPHPDDVRRSGRRYSLVIVGIPTATATKKAHAEDREGRRRSLPHRTGVHSSSSSPEESVASTLRGKLDAAFLDVATLHPMTPPLPSEDDVGDEVGNTQDIPPTKRRDGMESRALSTAPTAATRLVQKVPSRPSLFVPTEEEGTSGNIQIWSQLSQSYFEVTAAAPPPTLPLNPFDADPHEDELLLASLLETNPPSMGNIHSVGPSTSAIVQASTEMSSSSSLRDHDDSLDNFGSSLPPQAPIEKNVCALDDGQQFEGKKENEIACVAGIIAEEAPADISPDKGHTELCGCSYKGARKTTVVGESLSSVSLPGIRSQKLAEGNTGQQVEETPEQAQAGGRQEPSASSASASTDTTTTVLMADQQKGDVSNDDDVGGSRPRSPSLSFADITLAVQEGKTMASWMASPRFDEDDVKLERESVSFEELASAMADVHGTITTSSSSGGGDQQKHRRRQVEDVTDEEMARFDAALGEVPEDERKALSRAIQVCPDQVQRLDRALFLLTTETSDPCDAARKMCRHWEMRVDVFGEDKAFLPMTLDGALRDDWDTVWGINHIWPVPPGSVDRFGRSIMLVDARHYDPQLHDVRSLIRATWYMFQALAYEAKNPTAGVIILRNAASHRLEHFDLEIPKTCFRMMEIFPMIVRASHDMRADWCDDVVRPAVAYTLGRRMRHRSVSHRGSDAEIMKSLSQYGIDSGLVPVEFGGSLSFDRKLWLEHRREAGL